DGSRRNLARYREARNECAECHTTDERQRDRARGQARHVQLKRFLGLRRGICSIARAPGAPPWSHASPMDLMPRLPPVALRGPRPAPLMGAMGNVLGFFRDPVGVLLALKHNFGDVVPLADKNPAWVALFGGAHNARVLAAQSLFHNFADIPLKVPPGSAP